MAVLLHGGFWRSAYGRDLMAPLAADLVDAGWATWNLEYRRVGDGGGWPATFDDVAAGIGALRKHIDAGPVVTVGHSAGGHLALWAGDRVDGAVSLAGVVDLVEAWRLGLSRGAVAELLGGGPDDVADRFASASPARPGVPHLLVHGRDDAVVPVAFAEVWDDPQADVVVLDGVDHMAVIDPASAAWAEVRAWLTRWI